MERLFKMNDRVSVSGDIEFDDYNVRVCTYGTIQMDEVEGETQLLVTLDEIDGDQNVTVYVDTDRLKPYKELKSWKHMQIGKEI